MGACGTYALEQVAKTLRLQYDPRVLLKVPSPTNGFSMKALADLSAQLGLGIVAVTRGTDTKLVVPSLVHWEQNHYGAIVGHQVLTNYNALNEMNVYTYDS